MEAIVYISNVWSQEKMRGQRERLPVQALRYGGYMELMSFLALEKTDSENE